MSDPAGRRRVVLAVLAIAAIAAILWLRSYFSEEAKIARLFGDAAEAVAEERLLAVAQKVSRGYGDPYGQTYESFLGGVSQMFDGYEDLALPHSVRAVSISGATAEVELTFRLYGRAGGERGLLLGETLDPARAVIRMREERGSWKIERVLELHIPGAPAPP